ncbi:MAG: 50S ribosomal protein L3 N(5)-glutamine methyltransferase [Betaproteobacteria bacterium]|nr:50S ribosomal protein L3 N(5)-glutamine methyltransferase [Betaproteobacteria bacterium]
MQHSRLKTGVPGAVPRTVGGLVRSGSRRFRAAGLVFGHGTGNARDEAAYLTLHALRLPPGATPTALARPVGLRDARRVLNLFERRIRSRKPAAYLTREAWLAGNRFYVDERVIVPRSHIAGLLPDQLDPWLPGTGEIRTALDLCAGSGCLAVLLAKRFPRARIDAADVSPDALAVARINVRRHRLGRRIRLVESDLFSALREQRYDLVVCNPPYVTTRRMQRLPREYRHEPRTALAGGMDGLDIVRRLLGAARCHLTPRGLLVVEIGSARDAVERAYPRLPFIWLDTPGGGDVFLLTRERLPSAARAPASRAR